MRPWKKRPASTIQRLLLRGHSAFPGIPDWERFRKIADEVGGDSLGGYGPTFAGPGGRRRSSLSRPLCGCGNNHNPQKPARSTGRNDFSVKPSMPQPLTRPSSPAVRGGLITIRPAAIAVALLEADTPRVQGVMPPGLFKNASALADAPERIRIPAGFGWNEKPPDAD